MKNNAFDLPGRAFVRAFDFDKDLAYGKHGEAVVSSFLDSISFGDFEVKSDRYRNGKMVVETNQNPKGATNESGEKIWVPSGINVTTAKWWVYIYSPEDAFVVVSVARLKRYLRKNSDKFNEKTKFNFGGEDNPARGFLLMPYEVMDMLFSDNYDE